jgi:flavodoxin I
MKMKVAIIYSHSAKKTSQVAQEIKKASKWGSVDDLDVEAVDPISLQEYNLLFLGAPTWFDGELPSYWDELIPAIEQLNFKKTKIAIFGNGDQIKYPENFGDAVGILAQVFESSGATIVGFTSTEDYNFLQSKALKSGKFCGLILDFENQHKLNKKRITDWIASINP